MAYSPESEADKSRSVYYFPKIKSGTRTEKPTRKQNFSVGKSYYGNAFSEATTADDRRQAFESAMKIRHVIFV